MNDKNYNYCINILSKRDYSEQKIIEKLVLKGLDEFEIDQLVQKLKDENFLNPKRYLTEKVETLAKKGFSLQYIQEKLQRENLIITIENIRDLVSSEEIDHLFIIKDLLDKKLSEYINRKSDLTEHQLRSKAMMFLSSKGYDYYQAIDILPKELSENIE